MKKKKQPLALLERLKANMPLVAIIISFISLVLSFLVFSTQKSQWNAINQADVIFKECSLQLTKSFLPEDIAKMPYAEAYPDQDYGKGRLPYTIIICSKETLDPLPGFNPAFTMQEVDNQIK